MPSTVVRLDFPRVIQGKQREMLDSRFALPACAVLAPFERPRDDQRTENGETEKGGDSTRVLSLILSRRPG